MDHKQKVAVIQMDAVPDAVSKRLNRATHLISKAVKDNAKLVVLPEMFNTGYEFHERNFRLAESLEGETLNWMKKQATQHQIHLAGSLLLRDNFDIYNAGFLVAPDGRYWRHDKVNVTLWERAYFREGKQPKTIAHTALGKLGLLICSDVLHPELWVQYAGEVDAMVVMFSPGNTSQAELIFPDGERLAYPEFEQGVTSQDLSSYPGFEVMQKHMAWMSVPLIFAGGTGVVRTKLPGLESLLIGSKWSTYVDQATDICLELPFAMGTMIGTPEKGMLVQGTTAGDGVISTEIELAHDTPQPSEPKPEVPAFHTNTFDHYIARSMLSIYADGISRLQANPA